MKRITVGAVAFCLTLGMLLWAVDHLATEFFVQVNDSEDIKNKAGDDSGSGSELDDAGEISDFVESDSQQLEETPEKISVDASFRLIENVTAQGPVTDVDRQEIDSHSFPPMRFRWDGTPEALNAGGFLLETESNELVYGGRRLDLASERDVEIVREYSPQVAIRLPDGRRLYFHYNVLARLREWVVDAGEDGIGEELELWVEVSGTNSVLLHTPETAGEPARTLAIRF